MPLNATYRPFLLVILPMLLLIAAHAGAREDAKTPKAEIPDTVFTFAPVVAGTEVSHRFTVKNAGEAPLNIPGIHTG